MSRVKRTTGPVLATIDGVTARYGGVTEVANDLGVEPTRVTTWISRQQRNRNGQRPPVAVLAFGMGTVHNVDAWRAWKGEPPVGSAGRRAAETLPEPVTA